MAALPPGCRGRHSAAGKEELAGPPRRLWRRQRASGADAARTPFEVAQAYKTWLHLCKKRKEKLD